jgi:arylsulfatase A-like enzyme
MKRIWTSLAVAAICVAGVFVVTGAAVADRPNVIVLLADDLGWTGVSCYGSDLHETPNIDRLARRGVKFTDAYAACTVCSPSRAALMTGKYPARLRVTDFLTGQFRPYAKLMIPEWTKRLEHDEVTLAEALKAAGYRTGHVGKWHLGYEGGMPEDHGFDVNMGGLSSYGYILPNKNYPNAKKGEYQTDKLTDEALEFIEESKDGPFFLYFGYHVVHTPIKGRADLVAYYEKKIGGRTDLKHANPVYAAMAASLDMSVGRIMDKLDELGLADNTLVIFTSDNGGLSMRDKKPTGFVDNHPLRRGKGSSFEGGHRVPFIVRWPGVAKAGAESDELISTVDIYPTVLAATGAAGVASHNANVDGVDLAGVIKNPAGSLGRDALYWHYPHYHAGGIDEGPYGAVRSGDWKLIEFYEDMRVELYNVKEDLGESYNLASREPKRADQLRAMLRGWRDEVAAQMPFPNTNYDPKRPYEQGKKR